MFWGGLELGGGVSVRVREEGKSFSVGGRIVVGDGERVM